MTQPNSLDQLHQECCEALRALGSPREGVPRTRGGAEWIGLLGTAGGVVWGLIATVYARLAFWSPQQNAIKQVIADLERMEQERKDADKAQAERVTALNVALESRIQELKSILESMRTELVGKVTPDTLNGARDGVYGYLTELRVPNHVAAEAAHAVVDIVGKPLLKPSDQDPPSSGPKRS